MNYSSVRERRLPCCFSVRLSSYGIGSSVTVERPGNGAFLFMGEPMFTHRALASTRVTVAVWSVSTKWLRVVRLPFSFAAIIAAIAPLESLELCALRNATDNLGQFCFSHAVELDFSLLVLFEVVELLEEKQPRGLLGVVELSGAAGLLPQDVFNILECLFEHGA
jgi:hypothetical protein